MKRLFDLIVGACAALALLLPLVLVALAVRLTSKGSALYLSDRVGRNNTIFKMPKFRSMQIGPPHWPLKPVWRWLLFVRRWYTGQVHLETLAL